MIEIKNKELINEDFDRRSIKRNLIELNNKLDKLQEDNTNLKLSNMLDHSTQSKENQEMIKFIKENKRNAWLKIIFIVFVVVSVVYGGIEINSSFLEMFRLFI